MKAAGAFNGLPRELRKRDNMHSFYIGARISLPLPNRFPKAFFWEAKRS
jgi:hypothetical protein